MGITRLLNGCRCPRLYPWIILFFAAMNVIFLGGKRRAFGSFVAVFQKEFPNITLTELNWVGDSYSALGYMSTGLSIAIILHFKRRYGLFQFIGSVWILISCFSSAYTPNPHWLFLTHTLFHGIGSSLVISIAGLVVNEYFDKKHPYHLLATTLVSGGSVAAILFIEFFSHIIQSYGWRQAFIILGIIYFIVIGSAALLFRKNPQLTELNNKKAVSCQCQGNVTPIHIPLLVLWFMDRVMISVVTYGLLLNLTHYKYKDHNNLVKSSILTVLVASGEASTYLIGAVITASTKDFFKEKLRYILLITTLSMGTCLILLEFYKDIKVVLYILCFLTGFSLGPSITFLYPAGEEFTRLPGHIVYPISLGGMGFGMIISPLLTAEIILLFNFRWFFFIQGCLIFLKAISLFIIIVILCFCQSRIDSIEAAISDNINGETMEKSLLDDITPILSESLRRVSK